MPVTAAMHLHGLGTGRGRRRFLRDIELAIGPGELVRIHGENGSGKTTLLRTLAGLLRPTGGSVTSSGRIAFVPERVELTAAIRCGEWLESMRSLRRLPPIDWDTRLAEAGLPAGVLGSAAGRLSKGSLQRVALVEALYADCDVLILDEPLSGLDPLGVEWIAQQFQARLAHGAAIVLSDHSSAVMGLLPVSGVLHVPTGQYTRISGDSDVVGGVSIQAKHSDGRALDETVRLGDSDMRLTELLSQGWHIVRVERC